MCANLCCLHVICAFDLHNKKATYLLTYFINCNVTCTKNQTVTRAVCMCALPCWKTKNSPGNQKVAHPTVRSYIFSKVCDNANNCIKEYCENRLTFSKIIAKNKVPHFWDKMSIKWKYDIVLRHKWKHVITYFVWRVSIFSRSVRFLVKLIKTTTKCK